jgi:hypothetical protein
VLTIGQVAKSTGIGAKTIRFYEAAGVLPAPRPGCDSASPPSGRGRAMPTPRGSTMSCCRAEDRAVMKCRDADRRRRGFTIRKMLHAVVGAVMAVSVIVGPGLADPDADRRPTFTKSKFGVPINKEHIKDDWTARGYSTPKSRPTRLGGREASTLTGEPDHDLGHRSNGIHLRRASCRGGTRG